MRIIINNAEEAIDYINEIKGPAIAELLFAELMKQPDSIRAKLYEVLTEEEQKSGN
ncbi:hypothetical protein [Anaerocolumna sp. MB42-C2]|uniref:hypothetical protein n=1 Tax=Anaerocolumna sp. MB42-C2 TaxID=3070997 RepID=UPI0027E0D59A|nr:hypothetical protein [Anaerocolumna sp. MB42-C2]WMJ87585.1 hypothetical protein RBU59_26720 [Anaerocolumna sp. MB42-C2]